MVKMYITLKYLKVDKEAGYIPANYYPNGTLKTQGVVDCSHFTYEVTGVGNTNSPKRYAEVVTS